jgi:hypothetical protein
MPLPPSYSGPASFFSFRGFLLLMLLLHFSPVTPSFFTPPPLVTGQFYEKVRYETKLYCFVRYLKNDVLKGLLHEIFGPFHWPIWMNLDPNKNRFWFLNFGEAPSI